MASTWGSVRLIPLRQLDFPIKTKSGINDKLDVWREVLESKGFKISRTKTEYIKCNFNENRNTNDEIVKIASQEIRKSKKIRYLGSIIQQEGEIGEDVNHRVQAGWVKWRSASRVLNDRRIPLKLKEKFYKTAIRPAILLEQSVRQY